eukprot:scaffold425_cov175-Amphora_coffeaeformis.AAC.5
MAMVVPSFQPILGDISRLVLPERLSFCSVNKEELLNESKPQIIVLQQQQQEHQQLAKKDEMRRLKFDPNKSTEENYAADNDNNTSNNHAGFMGRFASIRQQLDYSYHRVYTVERQRLQDVILSGMLDKTKRLACIGQQQHLVQDNQQHKDLPEQWVIFTAGVMGECFDHMPRGVGKSHTIRALAEKQRFPLSAFVWVDPDQIRHCLPEFEMLVHYDPAHAGDRTRKEAGMLSEVLTLAALEEGQSVIVDGSLRDAEWYEEYFTHLRETYPGIKIAIFHVTAPHEAVLDRAAVWIGERSNGTGHRRVIRKRLMRNGILNASNKCYEWDASINTLNGDRRTHFFRHVTLPRHPKLESSVRTTLTIELMEYTSTCENI